MPKGESKRNIDRRKNKRSETETRINYMGKICKELQEMDRFSVSWFTAYAPVADGKRGSTEQSTTKQNEYNGG